MPFLQKLSVFKTFLRKVIHRLDVKTFQARPPLPCTASKGKILLLFYSRRQFSLEQREECRKENSYYSVTVLCRCRYCTCLPTLPRDISFVAISWRSVYATPCTSDVNLSYKTVFQEKRVGSDESGNKIRRNW